MNYRSLGKTNWKISEISLGTWQVGGGWGGVFDEKAADKILKTAIERGVNFMDTADVYDDGKSEAAVAKAIKESGNEIYLATKCGRRIQPHVNEGYNPQILRKHVEDSLKNIKRDWIDLVQLHCPPSLVYEREEIFGVFSKMIDEGKIRAMGVSVEKVSEAIQAAKFEVVSSVQIIFNMFRLKPSEEFFALAKQQELGIIVRVPLASGLLTGKLKSSTIFHPEDHRTFNREGAAFDKGETFSGVPFEVGLKAVEELKEIFSGNEALANIALKWILMFPEVSTVIPGASNPAQVIHNLETMSMASFSIDQMKAVEEIYDRYIKKFVHEKW